MKSIVKSLDKALLNGALQGWWYRRAVAKTSLALESGAVHRIEIYNTLHQNPELPLLCDKYGSDKGNIDASTKPYVWPAHSYTELYGLLFAHRRAHVRRVFECGLGTNNPDLPSSMGVHGKPGASHRMWRDYFPNADVVGADIDRDVLFTEDRISTFYVDQTDAKSVRALWEQVGGDDFDLMIDDGLHTFDAGLCLFENSVHRLAKGGIYIIEDVNIFDLKRFKDVLGAAGHRVQVARLHRHQDERTNNNMVVVYKD